ncbi:MAG: hypothetical protein ACU843_17310 [Gammaproteobacteria bacterium]
MELKNLVRQIACLSWLFAVGISVALSVEQRPAQTGPPELIVKFTDSSPLGRMIRESRGRPMPEDPSWAGEFGKFSETLPFPMTAQRITSGSEVILALDTNAMVTDLRQKLGAYPGLSRILKSAGPRTEIYPRFSEEIRIEFARGTPERDEIQRAAECEKPEVCIEKLVTTLSKNTGYRLEARVINANRLGLAIDLEHCIREVMKRLRQRRDVEYVQPNTLLEHAVPDFP